MIPSTPYLNFSILRFLRNKSTIELLNANESLFFSKSRFSFEFLLDLIFELKKLEKLVVYVPDYICSDFLINISSECYEIVYYSLDSDLNPNWETIGDLTTLHKPDVFLLVHYFGKVNNLSRANDFCKLNDAVFLEDAAHLLDFHGEVGYYSMAVMFSPYKLLAIPSNAALVFNSEYIRDKFSIDFSFIKKVASKNLKMLTWSERCFSTISWLVKKTLKQFFEFISIPMKFSMPKTHDEGFTYKINHLATKMISEYPLGISFFLLKSCNKEFISNRRIKNYTYIKKWFEQNKQNKVRPLFLSQLDFIPYVFPIVIDKDYVDILYSRFYDVGVYVQSWPDLPHEVLLDVEKHSGAINLRSTIILLPVHQSLTQHHMKKVTDVLSWIV